MTDRLQIQFRRYEHADHDAVKKLHVQGLQQMQAYMADASLDADLASIEDVYMRPGEAWFLVGTTNGQVIAMGAYRRKDAATAEIKRIRVDAAYRRHGIGQQLLELLEQGACKDGYRMLCLDTTSNQLPAQRLFLRCGYEEVRRIPYADMEIVFYQKQIDAADGRE